MPANPLIPCRQRTVNLLWEYPNLLSPLTCKWLPKLKNGYVLVESVSDAEWKVAMETQLHQRDDAVARDSLFRLI